MNNNLNKNNAVGFISNGGGGKTDNSVVGFGGGKENLKTNVAKQDVIKKSSMENENIKKIQLKTVNESVIVNSNVEIIQPQTQPIIKAAPDNISKIHLSEFIKKDPAKLSMDTMDVTKKEMKELIKNDIPIVGTEKSNIESETSVGFGELLSDIEDMSTLVIREGPDLYQTILRTVCAYAIRCEHGQMPIQKLKKHNGFWLPFSYANDNEKYSQTIEIIYESFLNDYKGLNTSNETRKDNGKKLDPAKFLKNIQLYSIYRFQIPDGQFISRYIFLAYWSGLDSSLPCCKDNDNIKWVKLENFTSDQQSQFSDLIWDTELYVIASKLLQPHQLIKPIIIEFTSNEFFKCVGHFSASLRSINAQLLSDVKFVEKDIIKIYCDFVQHCFPSKNMTFCSFNEYFNKVNLIKCDAINLKQVFKAFCRKNKYSLLFYDFLLGLAVLDPNSASNQLRLDFIFKYYDKNSDNYLDIDDFKRMIHDIHEKTNQSCAPDEIENSCRNKLSNLKLLDNKKRISRLAFNENAGKINSISTLLQASKSVMESIQTRHLYEYISNKTGRPFSPRLIGTCQRCKPKNYSLAYHAVKINNQGRIDDSKPLVSLNCGEIDVEQQFKQKTNEIQIQHSLEVVFNENSIANRVLAIIRKMVNFKKLSREEKKKISENVISSLTVDLIIQLCKEVTEIFLIEPPVLKLNTPCIVMGDIHGNINDLLTYEEQLWPLAPTSNAPNVLFLGDYVDRGDFSIEVISYLFAMKILAPTKFFLLRGNHELRSIQKNFTFFKECFTKYYSGNDQRIFDAFNIAFDHLPLVGIIDESIFCVHGGIPYSTSKVSDLYKIPKPLKDPEFESRPAWEILWSDPITDEEYKQVCHFRNQTVDNGYTDNLRRSTAYYFTEKALRAFLKANNLSHVIRAHELQSEGYRFHHSGLLITVFSSSRYCNTNNKSAAVFVDSRENEGFIKVIALET